MNFFILIMLVLCLAGLLDKILNNRLGLVEAFDCNEHDGILLHCYSVNSKKC